MIPPRVLRTLLNPLFLAVGGTLCAVVLVPDGLAARQIVDPSGRVFFPADSAAVAAQEQALAPEPVSPRGAFLRSLALPGWGHAATQSFTRGGFYVAAQTGGLWMMGSAIRRRSEAQAFARVERQAVRARLELIGGMDPDSIPIAVEEDPAVQRWDGLVDARGQQVEDWVAFSLFTLLLGAADAYVAAHLMDYPEPLAIRVLPTGREGTVEVGVSLSLGRR